ncbi:hypothetical protein SmJEL517_g05189 [Synchytrium microbalum]|uniref:Uncharacterized protein n=1 Tax=Synchytrium microbalum TaxID=1806994 RepID=A0A507C1U6_9FUNG|nr:uncharacterized protein SmJEL517_g05189 [Synchytrium microbalum]TPX31473.1 hypothetical protein SmJEL517_g05189 [Synchytrium microbalum]
MSIWPSPPSTPRNQYPRCPHSKIAGRYSPLAMDAASPPNKYGNGAMMLNEPPKAFRPSEDSTVYSSRPSSIIDVPLHGLKRPLHKPPKRGISVSDTLFSLSDLLPLGLIGGKPPGSNTTRRLNPSGGSYIKQFELLKTNPLWMAANDGNLPLMQQILEADPSQINQKGAEGESVLHVCLLRGTPQHLEVASYLIRKFKRQIVNEVYGGVWYTGETASHLAVMLPDKPTAKFYLKLLIQNGAELDKFRVTGRYITTSCSSRPSYSHNDFVIAKDSLRKTVEVYTLEARHSVLSFAACTHKLEIVKLLVTGATDSDGFKWPQLSINGTIDSYGNSILHLLAFWNMPSMYTEVENLGGNHELRNFKGHTPFLVAVEQRHRKFVDEYIKLRSEIFWKFGPVTATWYDIEEIDSLASNEYESALEIAARNEDDEMMAQDLFKAVLEVKWIIFGWGMYIRRFIVTFLYMFILSLVIQWLPYNQSDRLDYGGPNGNGWFRAPLEIIVIVGAAIQMMFEIKDILANGIKYLSGFGGQRNATQFSFCALIFAALILRFVQPADGNANSNDGVNGAAESAVLALAALIGWIYLLSFARGSRSFGPLWLVFSSTLTTDVVKWLILFGCFSFSFAQAFYLLMQNTGVDDWSTLGGAVVWTIRILFGQGSYDDFRSSRIPTLGAILFLTYAAATTILLVNVLIAMLSVTFGLIQGSAETKWRLQWTQLLLDLEAGLTDGQKRKIKEVLGIEINKKRKLLYERYDSEDRPVKVIFTRSATSDGFFCPRHSTSKALNSSRRFKDAASSFLRVIFPAIFQRQNSTENPNYLEQDGTVKVDTASVINLEQTAICTAILKMDEQLVAKLGHSLEEVRSRAWAAVSFKLSTSVITIADLVHHVDFLYQLLNWFNRDAPSQPNKIEEMLKLTLSLVRHPGGKTKINSIGGVLFFKSLRNSLPTSLPECQRLADDIVETLLHFDLNSPGQNTHRSQMPWAGSRDDNERMRTRGAISPVNQQHNQYRFPNAADQPFRQEARARSRSPERMSRSVSPMKVPQIVPPYLPNAISTYEILHLSPHDESLVSHFCTLMSATVNDTGEEARLFNVLKIDFGAQIFLQRSQLFRAVMNGVFADIEGRPERSWIYLEELVRDWGKSLRRFTDTIIVHTSATPMNATPNVSMTGGTLPETRPAISDYAVSLPFACHEIYLRLVPLLRDPTAMPRALRILYGVLPFLRIQIDVILSKGWGGPDTPPPSAVVAHYASFAVEVIGYHGLHSEIESPDDNGHTRLLTQEHTIAFCFDAVCALAPMDMEERNQLLWTCMLQIFDLPGSNSVPSTIVRALLSADTILIDLLTCLLTYPQMWVRLATYEVLVESPEITNTALSEADGGLFVMIVERGLRDESGQVQQLAYNVITEYLGSSPNIATVKSAIPLFQAYADLDDGHLLQTVLSLLQNDLTPSEKCIMYIRGLLHRNDVCRKASFEGFRNALPLTTVIESALDGPNVFIFSTTAISSFQVEQDHIPQDVDLEGRLAALRNHSVDSSLKTSALADLVSVITSKAIMSRAIQLGLLQVILQLLKNPGMTWIWEDGNLINALTVIRTFVEHDDQACDIIQGDVDFLTLLSSLMFSPLPNIRYELSRIFFSALCCARVFRSLGTIHNDLQSPGRSISHRRIPQALSLNFLSYGHVSHIPDPFYDLVPNPLDARGSSLLWSVMKDYRQFATSVSSLDSRHTPTSPFQNFVSEGCRRLQAASSHLEFQRALQVMSNNCMCETDWLMVSSQNLAGVLGRFLMTPPASPEDANVLGSILDFLASMAGTSTLPDALFPTLISSIRRVLLFVLERGSREDVGSTINWRDLSASIAGFLSWFLVDLPENELVGLISSSSIVSVLVNYASRLFLHKQITRLSPAIHRDTLTCLITVTSLPSLAFSLSGTVVANAIRVLVSYIALVQHEGTDWSDEEALNGNRANGNIFTYCGRNAYQLAAVGLRNLSRIAVETRDTEQTWVWGEHWLVQDDIQWLMTLLNDDEKTMQKVGLGILGNLILVKGSYQYLCIKIPQFLDMAFAYILDFERVESIRKEAFLVINNFIITFCVDNKLKGGSMETDESSIDQDVIDLNNIVGNGNGKIGPDPTSELLKIFDHCGFFDKLRDVLSEPPRAAVAYRTAVSEILVNLLLINPDALRSRLALQSAWPTIIDYLAPAYEAREPDEDDEPDSSISYQLFRRRQFTSINGTAIDNMRCTVLQCVRLACFGDAETRRVLVSTTDAITVLVFMIDELWSTLESSTTKSNNQATWYALRMSALSLSDLLWDACAHDKAGLEGLLSGSSASRPAIVTRILAASLALVRRKTDATSVSAGVQLLGRILSMHCGEVADIGVDLALKQDCQPGRANKGILGPELCHELMTIIIEEYETSSPGHIESARIALQCLMGRCEVAKIHAIQANFSEMIISRMNIVRSANRIDESHQMELFTLTCLLRHLFAGSIDAKQQALDCGAQDALSELLGLSRELGDALLLELLCCVRNMVASCVAAKRAVVEPPRKKPGGLCCVDGVVKIMKTLQSNATHDEIFLACIEVLKLLALSTTESTESRTAIIKSNILNDIYNLLTRFTRSKEMLRVDGILQFLYSMSLSHDGQIHTMRVAGLFPLLVDLLSSKSPQVKRTNLLLLKNLLSTRENKAHALADENFMSNMLKFGLQSKSLTLLSPATSCIWVFLYDSEKAKVALKKSTLKEDLVALERRLVYDYAWFLQVDDPKDPRQWDGDFDREDAENLVQTLQNIAAIARLLSI